ncbi:hypothetical protein PoB_007252400, partial [Plakobranchus ocellatus]
RSSVRLKNDIVRLPPIGIDSKRPGSEDQYSTSPLPIKQDTPPEPQPLPEIQRLPKPPVRETKPKPEIRWTLTEAEEVKWKSEQRQEMLSVPNPGYVPPRLVLISSHMPWCQSMANAVKKYGRILYIVYLEDTGRGQLEDTGQDSWKTLVETANRHWSTQLENTGECQTQLDHFSPGSKALSIMLIGQGGPGYFYLLKSFVMTPQKLKRSKYNCMREFWRQLAAMVSKLMPEDACIHLVGTEFDTSEQGKKVNLRTWSKV